MPNPQTELMYLAPALEVLRLLTSLAERYADGQLSDEEFKTAWAETARQNTAADAAWLASVGQAVS